MLNITLSVSGNDMSVNDNNFMVTVKVPVGIVRQDASVVEAWLKAVGMAFPDRRDDVMACWANIATTSLRILTGAK